MFVRGEKSPLHTHDWHVQPFVKDRRRCFADRKCPRHIFRLSGAFSVRTKHTSALAHVLETFQSYRVPGIAVNPLRAQDFHLISTVRGGSIQNGGKACNSLLENSLDALENALPPIMGVFESRTRQSGR
jgi:hypothetical protein